MASINQIASSIVNELNQANNHELFERIKDRAKFLNATIIKRNIDKYGISDDLILPLRFKLQKVKNSALCKSLYNDTRCFIYETVNKIPTPIRSINRPIFSYIGALGGVRPFYFTSDYNIPILRSEPINRKQVFVALKDRKLRIYGVSELDYIEVTMPVANIDEIVKECDSTTSCLSDDDEFLAPYDIIDSIIRTLVDEFIKVNNPNSNYEINIDAIDKQTID